MATFLVCFAGGGEGVEAMAVGRWHVSVISWRPAVLLMFIRALSLLDTQRLYRARKSAVVDAVVAAVAAGSIAAMGSQPSRFKQHQPRRASWIR